MRNKQKFLDATNEVIQDKFKEELNVVEDAAHLMNNLGTVVYTIPEVFTNTGKDEIFKFEIKPRPMTDNPEKEIDDYFYTGRGE